MMKHLDNMFRCDIFFRCDWKLNVLKDTSFDHDICIFTIRMNSFLAFSGIVIKYSVNSSYILCWPTRSFSPARPAAAISEIYFNSFSE